MRKSTYTLLFFTLTWRLYEPEGGDKSVSREFSRQVDIPPNINPQSLRSTLSNDGILQVIITFFAMP